MRRRNAATEFFNGLLGDWNQSLPLWPVTCRDVDVFNDHKKCARCHPETAWAKHGPYVRFEDWPEFRNAQKKWH